MNEATNTGDILNKIGQFDTVEILVNDRKEMLFEGIIDPVYIKMHFDRVVNTSRDFDIVKLMGYHGQRSKELIAEVFVGR